MILSTMRRTLLLVLAVILIVSGIFLTTKISGYILPHSQGALQITTNVKSDVYLNNKHAGTTPYCKCTQNDTVDTGDYDLKIEPVDKSFPAFQTKIKVEKGVLTAVERTFLPNSLSSAYTLTLEKSNKSEPQLSVLSLPDGAMVTLDGLPAGATPYEVKSISASEHEIEIQKTGFAKKTLRVRTVNGYRLIVSAILGSEGNDSDLVLPTVAPTSLTPTPEKSSTTSLKSSNKKNVVILQTPNGFLRVRQGPSTATSEIGRVKPGETYEVLEEQSGWYKISIDDETEGWVSGSYAQKQ